MRKEFYFFIVLILLQSAVLQSQEVQDLTEAIPQEKMFVHYNSSLFLAGESLRYKLYAINESTNKLSDISKLGYVEVIRQDGIALFQQKIDLESGSGYGDFFIPIDVKSGNYKIVAYTQWMKNAGKENFFKGDLAIINPYTEDQGAISDSTGANNSSFYLDDNYKDKREVENALVTISTSAEKYRKREKVILNITFKNADAESGSYSVLVRKLDTFAKPQHTSASNWSLEQQSNNLIQNSDGINYFPEMRGEIINGKILNKMSANGSFDKRIVALSIPGRNDILKFAQTDEEGNFHFNLNVSNFEGESAVLQVMNRGTENFQIQLEEKFVDNYQDFNFNNFRFKPEMREWLKKRSIYNQIENSYLAEKSDEIILSSESTSFYGELPEVYNLDDYNRFPTVRETFVEIIRFGAIRKGNDGQSQFEVRSYKSSLSTGLPTLLLVDGVLIQNHEEFMDFDSRKIQRIGILRDKYFLGPLVFQGIITIETKQQNYFPLISREDILETKPLKTSPQKLYFHPDYEASQQARIPDFRFELYWNPNLKFTKGNKNIEFYTSDVSGTYQVSLEGFTGEGKPVSATTTIDVVE
ncbi:hypothetical protein RM549_14320 [Salegentibacter sp. F188]|uniref:Macroglobulin domain-containing protein n=1 Tax=Autumnicola patrickiae TaxID=3075591 RepID=A0ABU3E4P2_9FLAO|nr:hypothetical protein [Salegentibacter sp. F188]MDT0690968.1 hypothetical protein [Salegentibacter sp. F188]